MPSISAIYKNINLQETGVRDSSSISFECNLREWVSWSVMRRFNDRTILEMSSFHELEELEELEAKG